MLRLRAALGLAGLVVATAALIALPASAAAATPTVTEFSQGISANSNPFGIATGPDGNLWFTDEDGRIGRITPSGTVTEFSAGLSAGSGPREITAGPDGNVWFTEHLAGRIGRITPAGTITEFGGLSPSSFPSDIAAGPDGNLWFTESNGNRVGRITPSGTVTEFSAGISPGSAPRGIAAGPDGNLWFTEYNTHRVARITPAGTVTEFSGLSSGSFPAAIAAGPDGNLWVAEFAGNRIARITTSGSVTEFSSGITGSGLLDIASGPDGNLWFTEFFDGRIGRITTALDPPAHANPAPISVPGLGTSGPASPYPSELEVAGLQGTVTDVRVRLTGIGHSYPDDLDILLVGPQGQKVLLASDVGGGNPPAHGVTLNLRDPGPFALPNGAPLVSGIFRPTDQGATETLPAPAPAGPYATTLSAFDGTSPNGSWQLFVRDDAGGDTGRLHRGWGLDITTTGAPAPNAGFDPAAGADPAAFGARTRVSLALNRKRSGRRKVVLRITNRNGFQVTGALAGRSVAKLRRRPMPTRVKLGRRSVSLAPRSRQAVVFRLPRRARLALARRRRLRLAFTARVRDSAGNTRTVRKRLTPKLARKKQPARNER